MTACQAPRPSGAGHATGPGPPFRYGTFLVIFWKNVFLKCCLSFTHRTVVGHEKFVSTGNQTPNNFLLVIKMKWSREVLLRSNSLGGSMFLRFSLFCCCVERKEEKEFQWNFIYSMAKKLTHTDSYTLNRSHKDKVNFIAFLF